MFTNFSVGARHARPLAAVESASSYQLFFDKIEAGNQTTPGKPYPNTTEAGFMKVNDNAGSQRVAE